MISSERSSAASAASPVSDRISRIRAYDHPLTLSNLDWPAVIAIGVLHLAALAAPFFFSWSAVGVAVLLWWFCGGLGICLGFHRLLTHRSFKTHKPIEHTLTILGTLNWQGSPIRWVGTHRLHHKHSDTDKDPHTPRHGFNWAHMMWCLIKDPPGYDSRDAARDLQRDAVMRFIDRHHYGFQFLLAGVLFVLGALNWGQGWSWWEGSAWVLWGVAFRTVFIYHATWFVNSASHTWGYRNFNVKDDSKNTWWVSLLSFGEGWHNNHHAQQRSAAHGMRWWEIDLTYLTIRLMAMCGLAWDVVEPDRRALAGH